MDCACNKKAEAEEEKKSLGIMLSALMYGFDATVRMLVGYGEKTFGLCREGDGTFYLKDAGRLSDPAFRIELVKVCKHLIGMCDAARGVKITAEKKGYIDKLPKDIGDSLKLSEPVYMFLTRYTLF